MLCEVTTAEGASPIEFRDLRYTSGFEVLTMTAVPSFNISSDQSVKAVVKQFGSAP